MDWMAWIFVGVLVAGTIWMIWLCWREEMEKVESRACRMMYKVCSDVIEELAREHADEVKRAYDRGYRAGRRASEV